MTPQPSPPAPNCCGFGADANDPIGCRGRVVAPYPACLAHLAPADQAAYLATLDPGSSIDHSSTPFTSELLNDLLAALKDPATGDLRIGDACFDDATFTGTAFFEGAIFVGRAKFERAIFKGTAWFIKATFTDVASFDGAAFNGKAWFDNTTFGRNALFNDAIFEGDASFMDATCGYLTSFNRATFRREAGFHKTSFTCDASFEATIFTSNVSFHLATFSDNGWFRWAEFQNAGQFGPLACGGTLHISRAVFGCPVVIEASTASLDCTRTRWAATASLRLRHASVDLSDAAFEYPMKVSAQSAPFRPAPHVSLDEMALAGLDHAVRILSLHGVDAAHLALTDVDLSECRFAGAVHLDQLRLEGECAFAAAPHGFRWHGLLPVRWTPRRTLAEEHHQRATRLAAHGWNPATGDVKVLSPAALAPIYRQLRKSFEDGKNEPDAADFYYGEMEMRRLDVNRPRGERTLLGLYWALSGYGLRASRALAWLLVTMAVTVLLMMLWGVPKDDPKPMSTGKLTGQQISLTTDTPDPVNPDGSLPQRMTTMRFEKSLRVVINSVVFRSSGQELTTFGTYIEMVSRVAEPALLGLAVLAIRGRVKR